MNPESQVALPFGEFDHPRGVILDTNVLLLFIAGNANRSLISEITATRAYQDSDYETLKRLVNRFRSILVTPNILTETSNLLGHRKQTRLFLAFSVFISGAREYYVPSASVAARSDLPRFGLTDLTIDECSGSNVAVITDDGPLYHFLLGRGVPAINFTYHRDMSIR